MVSFAIGRGGVARTFHLTPTPTCAGALFPFWGQGDSIPLMWPPGRPAGGSLVSLGRPRLLPPGPGWATAHGQHLACLMSVQSVRGVAVAVSRRPQASMARRFRLHDGGTRRRLGNPCKQMQMHAGGSGDRNSAETHLLMGAAAATTERGRRRTNPATRQTRAFFGLPGIPWLLHQCVEATIQASKVIHLCFFCQFLVPFLVLQYECTRKTTRDQAEYT